MRPFQLLRNIRLGKRVAVFACSVILVSSVGGCRKSAPPPSPNAKPKEVDYQKAWVEKNGGRMEVTLKDRTRVDILTKSHAFEMDHAEKWAEAIGQSLHYASMTGHKPGVILIEDEETDKKYIDRFKNVIEKYDLPIKLDIVGPDLLKNQSSESSSRR